MRPENILILTAVKMEATAMKRALAGRRCRFHTVGVGAKHLPDLQGVQVILLCGVAGALDPGLRVGDVVLDAQTQVLRYAKELDLSSTHWALGSTSEPAFIRRGLIHTADQIIATPRQKSELFRSTSALAVDMEQAIVHKFAEPFHVPVMGLRAISDTADQTLDPEVIHLIDEMGNPKPLRIASLLIRRPQLIPYLKQLGDSTKLALQQLGKAAAVVVDKLTGSKGT
jgi:uridine phosphorylase